MVAPSSSAPPTGHRLRGKRLHLVLLLVFLGVWLATAIAPHDRGAWILEHSIVAVFLALVLGGYRRWRLTDVSYSTVTLFLILHTLGAWTTYQGFPAGLWVQDWFDLDRNHYDRFVHFAFGLLMSQPCREIVQHYVRVSARWARLLAIPFVLSVSTVFELIESWAARIVAPDVGAAFLAIQGDEWDAQKDVTMAVVGALVWYLGDAVRRRRKARRSPPPDARPI